MKRDPLPYAFPAAADERAGAIAWRAALAALVAALVWIGAWYGATAAAMAGIWARSETFAHGFVVAPIALWLIWRMRRELRALTPDPSWVALPFLALAGAAWLLGRIGTVNALSQAAFVAMLVLTVPAILGLRIARAMMFPLGFLFFAVPFGEFLLPLLMERTADFTILALRASGVPVYREGLQFVIPTGRWSIVEACSGVRYLIASLMAGTLFAYLNYTAQWRRFAFVGVSIAVPIIANWLRAYMIVMLGHLSNNRIATGVDHIIYGWVFFGVVMLLMFWIGSRWQERLPPAAARAAVDPALAGASRVRFGVAALAVLAMTVVWPLIHAGMERGAADRSATLRAVDVPGWQSTDADAAAWVPHFERPSATLHQVLREGDAAVGLYIAYYRGQSPQRKLVSSENVMVRSDDHKWLTLAEETSEAVIGDRARRIGATTIRGAGGQALVAWHWYWIDGTLTASDVVAKARIAWARLTGRGDDAAAIVIYTADDGRQPAPATLRAFVRDAWPAIDAALTKAQSGQ